MFIPPHPSIPIPYQYFTVRSGQEMDLAPVIAINFMCCKFFLYFSGLSRSSPIQRWSRGHKARGQGQGHKKNPRLRTAFPRTDTLEAKDRNAQGQGQGPRTQAQVLSKKKRSSQKFFRPSPQQNVFQKIFQVLHKILTIQIIVLSSSRGQANFRGLEASRPMSRT